MFKELLNQSQVGGKTEIGFVLFDLLKSNVLKNLEDVKLQCLHHSYSFGSCFNGTIVLLKALELVFVENEMIRKNQILDEYNKLSFFDSGFFFRRVFELLDDNDQFLAFFNSNTVKFNLEKSNFYLRDSHLPIKHSTLKKVFINTGLFIKDLNVNSIFFINQDYLDFFRNTVIEKMASTAEALNQQRKISLDHLKARLKQQEVLGLQAEIFVLSYEKHRLKKHPFISKIVRVSDDYSNAGYDIESFNDAETILINRFIEVKSFSGEISFFWSNNEIESAKEKADQYFIYLVNRDEIENPDYRPVIISNPYENVFQNSIWVREVGQYKFYLSKGGMYEN